MGQVFTLRSSPGLAQFLLLAFSPVRNFWFGPMWWSCLHINSPWYLAKWIHISAHVLVELETFHWKWCSPNHTSSWFRSCQNLTQPEILAHSFDIWENVDQGPCKAHTHDIWTSGPEEELDNPRDITYNVTNNSDHWSFDDWIHLIQKPRWRGAPREGIWWNGINCPAINGQIPCDWFNGKDLPNVPQQCWCILDKWPGSIVMLESSELGPSWCHVKRPAIKLPEMTKEAEVLLIALTWNYLKWPMKLIICRTIICSRNFTLVLVENSFNIWKKKFFSNYLRKVLKWIPIY